MRIEKNYLNDKHEFEKIDILGYVSDAKDYYEAYSETRGHFIVPASRVYPVETNSMIDILCTQNDIRQLVNRILYNH